MAALIQSIINHKEGKNSDVTKTFTFNFIYITTCAFFSMQRQHDGSRGRTGV